MLNIICTIQSAVFIFIITIDLLSICYHLFCFHVIYYMNRTKLPLRSAGIQRVQSRKSLTIVKDVDWVYL